MAELDRLDVRLTAAVRAFADRADASVDATAVADLASARRGGARTGRGRPMSLPVVILTLVTLLGLLVWSIAAGNDVPLLLTALPSPTATAPIAVATADPTPAPTPHRVTAPPPTATPAPPADPMAPAYVSFSGMITGSTAGTVSGDGDLERMTGTIVYGVETASDPRVSGDFTMELSAAGTRAMGFEWGTKRIENAGGRWEGTCRGAFWSGQNESEVSCWLVGYGDYAGLTFSQQTRSLGLTGEGTGVILPVEPPGP